VKSGDRGVQRPRPTMRWPGRNLQRSSYTKGTQAVGRPPRGAVSPLRWARVYCIRDIFIVNEILGGGVKYVF
jgi:hypothetical protein